MLDKINLKEIAIIFSFYSIVYNYSYFSFYGINIFEFATLTDLLNLFVSEFIKITAVWIIGFIFTAIISYFIYRFLVFLKIKINKNNIFEVDESSFRLKRKFSILLLLSFFLILSLSFFFLMIFYQNDIYQYFIVMYMSFILISILLAYYLINKLKRFWQLKYKLSQDKIQIYFFSIFIIPHFIILYSGFEISNLDKYVECSFIYNDKIFITGNNYIYIGKAGDKTFLYDKNQEETLYMNNSEIKNFKRNKVILPNIKSKKEAITPEKGF